MSRLQSDTVGEIFVSASGDVYKQLSYCEHPTVCIENVMTGEVQNHVVNCMNINIMKLERAEDMEYNELLDSIIKLANFSISVDKEAKS